jgi:hypothetical protein
MKFQLTELTEQEVNTIIAGLSELPAKYSIELLMKIKIQCEEQLPKEQNLETE